MTLAEQQERVAIRQRQADAKKGKPGYLVRLDRLQTELHALLIMQNRKRVTDGQAE